jgi:SAM-dependent methyltransferase
MVNWALEHVRPSTTPWILEVGSGNGTLLFGLLDAGYMPERLQGIDYSPGSIKLARSIAATRGDDKISFHLCDFLNEDVSALPHMAEQAGADSRDLILDKGTFDAIALMEKDNSGMAPVDGYPSKIARLLKPGGHFLITCTLPVEPVCIAHELTFCRCNLKHAISPRRS